MKSSKNEFKGCIMINLDIDNWISLKDLINEEDLENTGFEKDPHITLVYGLHSLTSAMVLNNLLHDTKLIGQVIKLSKVGGFKNERFDVLKYEIDEPKLYSNLKLQHENIVGRVDNELTFSKYSPHCTIAYLKSGKLKDYKDKMPEVKGIIKEFWYSTKFKAD